MSDEMVILTKAFDLLAWVIPRCEKFPRAHRQTVSKRISTVAMDLQEWLNRAQSQRGDKRLHSLREADHALDNLRLYMRLAYHWQWLSVGQYEHVSRMILEIGRLLGGWVRASSAGSSAQS